MMDSFSGNAFPALFKAYLDKFHNTNNINNSSTSASSSKVGSSKWLQHEPSYSMRQLIKVEIVRELETKRRYQQQQHQQRQVTTKEEDEKKLLENGSNGQDDDSAIPTTITTVLTGKAKKEDPLKALRLKKLMKQQHKLASQAPSISNTLNTIDITNNLMQNNKPWYLRHWSEMNDICRSIMQEEYYGVKLQPVQAIEELPEETRDIDNNNREYCEVWDVTMACHAARIKHVRDAPSGLRCWEELPLLISPYGKPQQHLQDNSHPTLISNTNTSSADSDPSSIITNGTSRHFDVLYCIGEICKERLQGRLPTAIQAYTIPIALTDSYRTYIGEVETREACHNNITSSYLYSNPAVGVDVVGVAETGSGKTLAYLVPCLYYLVTSCGSMYQGAGDNCAGGVKISLKAAQGGTLSLIITPTRELATQVMLEFEKLVAISRSLSSDDNSGGHNNNMKRSYYRDIGDLSVLKIVGGESTDSISVNMAKGVHCIVGTLEPIYQLIAEKQCLTMRNCRFVAVDEADKLFDDSNDVVQQQLMTVLEGCAPRRQSIFFSATMSNYCRNIIDDFMSTCGYYVIEARPKYTNILQCFEVFPVASASSTLIMPKEGKSTTNNKKKQNGAHQQQEKPLHSEKVVRLLDLIKGYCTTSGSSGNYPVKSPSSPSFDQTSALGNGNGPILPPIIIFTNEQGTCDLLTQRIRHHSDTGIWCSTCLSYSSQTQTQFKSGYDISESNPAAVVISISMKLSKEEREARVRRFIEGRHRILVTTDLLARGLDVPSVGLVVNFDMPIMRTIASVPKLTNNTVSNGDTLSNTGLDNDNNNNGKEDCDDGNEPNQQITEHILRDKDEDAMSTYTHRIGRTGRAGANGVAVTFICLPAASLKGFANGDDADDLGNRKRPRSQFDEDESDDESDADNEDENTHKKKRGGADKKAISEEQGDISCIYPLKKFLDKISSFSKHSNTTTSANINNIAKNMVPLRKEGKVDFSALSSYFPSCSNEMKAVAAAAAAPLLNERDLPQEEDMNHKSDKLSLVRPQQQGSSIFANRNENVRCLVMHPLETVLVRAGGGTGELALK